MKRITMFLCLMLMIGAGCNQEKKSSEQMSAGDDTFNKLSEEFLKGYLEWRPQLAVYLGLHEYDGKMRNYTKVSIDNELNRLKNFETKFDALDTASLSPASYYDLRILMTGIKEEIFNIEDMQSYTKNPMSYAGVMDVNIYISRNFAPIEERIGSIINIENKAPDIFSAARENLDDSLPKPYIDLAIQIAQGSADFLGKELINALRDVHSDSLMQAFKASNDKAIKELKSFASWLEKEKLPKANNDFGIGHEKYSRMLQAEYIDIPPEKILEIGMRELKKEQEEFVATAKIINPDKKAIDVYHDIQKEHPAADSLIARAGKDLEKIRQFIIDHKIVTIPSDVRANVKETPQYARSTSTASMDTPGPFETKATEAYYYVTPVDPSWTAKQKEDWLRMFDFYTMDNVSVHEAYPGHYVQFLHLNASNATKIEKIFASYEFVEGWAHYCEKMMIDEGFGNNGDPVTAAKFKLAQLGDALLRLCRLCSSVQLHCYGMSVDDATKFFMDNWYQGEEPSRQEALRGTFDPGYLFYTLGKLQILKLRDDYKNQEGSDFSLEKFNDLVLDNGMPPIRLLREKILTDRNKWNDIL